MKPVPKNADLVDRRRRGAPRQILLERVRREEQEDQLLGDLGRRNLAEQARLGLESARTTARVSGLYRFNAASGAG